MRFGTPGFISSRLTEARAERGLSGRALAEQIGVSPNAISMLETGATRPHPETVEKLCAALKVPQAYFFMPIEEERGSAVFYRAQRTTSVRACTAAEARLRWLHRLGVVVEEAGVNLYPVNLPTFDLPADPLAIPDTQIESLAVQTRKHWKMGLGPISNVLWLLESNGVLINRSYVDADQLDGVSQFFPDHPVVLLAANKESGPRSRFDAAHELGHLVLHRNVEAARLNRPGEWKAFENQAHRFAAAFLFPEEAFRAEVRSVAIDDLLALKMRWKVSAIMMLMRAEKLGFIAPERAERLHINYGRRGYKRGEPLDDQIPPEQPRLLRSALDILVATRGHEEVRARLPFDVDDAVRLTGSPRGILTGETAQVVALPLAHPVAPGPRRNEESRGTVLPFPGVKGA